MKRRRPVPVSVAAAVIGAFGIPAGAALPWVLSGQAEKSVFSLAKSARELGLARVAADLGIVNETVVRAMLWTLFGTPLLAGLVVLLLACGQRLVVGLVSLIAGAIGVVGGGVGLVFANAPLWGPRVTLAGGISAIVGAIGLFRDRGIGRFSAT